MTTSPGSSQTAVDEETRHHGATARAQHHLWYPSTKQTPWSSDAQPVHLTAPMSFHWIIVTIPWSGFAMTVSGARTWRLRKRMCTASDSPVSKQKVRIQTQAFRSKASALSLCQMSCYESTKISTRTYGNNYRGPRQQLRSQPATSQWGTPFNLGGGFTFYLPSSFRFLRSSLFISFSSTGSGISIHKYLEPTQSFSLFPAWEVRMNHWSYVII